MIQRKTNLLFNDSALQITLNKLKKYKGYAWSNIKSLNRDRYFFIEGFGHENVGVLFHREFFHKFGEFARMKKWKNEKGQIEAGLGESINVKHLKMFVRNKVKKLIYVYPNSNVYEINVEQVLDHGHKWTQKEGTEVYSFNIHLMKNVEGKNSLKI